MILEIDMQFLLQHKLNAHQFVIIKLLSEKKYLPLKKYLNHVDGFRNFKEDLGVLQRENFVDPYFTLGVAIVLDQIPVTETFFNTQRIDEGVFEEFYNLYPVKVIRSNGQSDYLRTDRDRCKKIYNNIVHNNRQLHNKIVKCLKTELEEKGNHGQMKYMQRMSTWLTSESWKGYDSEYISNSNEIQNEPTYGTAIE